MDAPDLPDSRELQKIDHQRAAQREPDAEQLCRKQRPDDCGLLDAPHDSRNRLPPRADSDEQGAREPDICRSLQRADAPRNPFTNRVTREKAVVERKYREQRHVDQNRARLDWSYQFACKHNHIAVGEIEQRIDKENESAERDRSSESLRHGAG